VVALGLGDEIQTISPSGRTLRRWTLEDLGFAGQDRTAVVRDTSLTTAEQVRMLRRSGVVVEEVLWIGSSPAVILRASAGERPGWFLAVLGENDPEVFRIPVTAPRDGVRLRADSTRAGEIVLLLGGAYDPTFRPASDEKLSEEIVVLRFPDHDGS
jgi:hypothetical protein